jgi:hybrid cluster-associated redox disulfide protein
MAKKKLTKKVSKLASAKKIKEKKKVTKKEAKQPITKQMLIGELASKYPEAIPLLFEAGMHCIGCGMTAYESLEQGCQAHGMGDKEIDKMVEEINKVVAEK